MDLALNNLQRLICHKIKSNKHECYSLTSRHKIILLHDFASVSRYEPPYPSSYGLNSTTTVLLGEWLWH